MDSKIRKYRIVSKICLLAGLSVFCMTGCGKSDSLPEGKSDQVVEQADTSNSSEDTVLDAEVGQFAVFESIDLEGNNVNQDILQNSELTMINIWGTFCSPCIKEMPDLGELSKEYSDRGVQIIGIPVDVVDEASLTMANTIVEKTKADYLHILPSEDLAKAYLNSVTAVPETIFVDKEGTIVKSVVGARSKEEWIKVLDELLQNGQKE